MTTMTEPLPLNDSSVCLWHHGPMTCYLIGDPACPILKRWTLKFPWIKVRLHHFYPNTRDRDTHDHPWPFLTFVLWGSYLDVRLDGRKERMRFGKVRYRSATHAHRTYAGPHGCLTLVIGPYERRVWGFFTDGKWMPWRKYMEKYGHGMVCDEDSK